MCDSLSRLSMLQVREVLLSSRRSWGAVHMQRFEVRQDHDDRWSVSSKDRILYLYSSEEEARWAALMLASDSC
jgi:hypothetical protein